MRRRTPDNPRRSAGVRRDLLSRFTPPQLIALAFALAIIIGTVLLWLPPMHAVGYDVSFLQALFTATSAVCVTGLIVVDTGSTFSVLGQIVIMLLIQIGGFGIITFGTLFATLRGRRVSIEERLRVAEEAGIEEVGGLLRMVKGIAVFTLVSELLGAIILFFGFVRFHDPLNAAYFAVFHSISAFNNAGFALYPDGLMRYASDPLILLPTAALFILGGLGYLVLLNAVLRYRMPRKFRLPLNSRMVFVTTGALILFGTLVVTVVEWNNPATLGPLSPGAKLLSGFFQGVTPRTAGFNSLDYAELLPATLFVTILLMLVGGSPGSTAGGLKTTTFFLLIASAVALVRGRTEVYAFRKRIDFEYVLRAGVVAVMSLGVVTLGVLALLVTNPRLPFVNVVFEGFSAFSTVGLSMNTTALFDTPGQLILVLLMYLGRIGPITFAVAFAHRLAPAAVRYPADRSIVVG